METVSESGQGERTDLTFNHDDDKLASASETRLRAINRAPEIVADLYRDGLINQVDGSGWYFGALDLFLAGVTDTRDTRFEKILQGVDSAIPWKKACFTGYLKSVFCFRNPLLYPTEL